MSQYNNDFIVSGRSELKEVRESFIQNIPSFERDDDLTVVTTAESIHQVTVQSISKQVPELPNNYTNQNERIDPNKCVEVGLNTSIKPHIW